ncbi:hypothetical protein ACQEVX_04845 [Streptomyces syringium]|uniref:hypothetical protein n=1 Tax=Streptomyces syringium TaxID=76729 RepID=UPI003D8EF868
MNEPDGSREVAPGLPPSGEVVEFFGFHYDVFGVGVGEEWEFWGAKRMPLHHDAMATHTNSGDSVPTRDHAVRWCKQEAWNRHIAKTVHARHPALYGPHRFSAEPVVETLEPGYERVIWMGVEWRLHAPTISAKQLWRSNALTPPSGIPDGHPREYQMRMLRGDSLYQALSFDLARLLGTSPRNVDCVMCEPGGAWGRHKTRKIRIGLGGRPEVNEVLCLHHALNYFVPWEEERRLYDLEGHWMPWRDMLHDWLYEDAEAVEAGAEPPCVRSRWQAHLAQATGSTESSSETTANQQARRALSLS